MQIWVHTRYQRLGLGLTMVTMPLSTIHHGLNVNRALLWRQNGHRVRAEKQKHATAAIKSDAKRGASDASGASDERRVAVTT